MKKILALVLPIIALFILFILLPPVVQSSGAAPIETAVGDDEYVIEQAGPPWIDPPSWHYRRPIIISNSGAYLSYYQVLITLDNSNFDFNKAKSDGTDIRVTDSSGRNPLTYWIESWDKANQLAYLWVLVSEIFPSPYNKTIYLYYDNPGADPVSDGLSPFDSFDDDWDQFIDSKSNIAGRAQYPDTFKGVDITFDWSIIGNAPEVTPEGYLSLAEGIGVTSLPIYQYQAVGFRANFGVNGEYERAGFLINTSGVGTMIGDGDDCPGEIDHLCLINSGIYSGFIPQDLWHGAFHVYEVRWKPGQSIGDIDHGTSSATSASQVPSTVLPVTLYSYAGSNATLLVDWVYVRQYRDPEPIAVVGEEQGLVELGIDKEDTPDPLQIGAELTYLITISNTSDIGAPGVVVTDTLSEYVQLAGVPPQGCRQEGRDIVCDQISIAGNSTENITIVVIPSNDGVITNTVIVASPGYELDISNNVNEELTLVDSVPPNVNWEKPVSNEQNYVTRGDLQITLEASATDAADRVAWAKFILYDHFEEDPTERWVTIGIDDTYPYRAQLDTDRLELNSWYQIYAQAADRAGNQSDFLNPLRRIIVKRLFQVNLPVIAR